MPKGDRVLTFYSEENVPISTSRLDWPQRCATVWSSKEPVTVMKALKVRLRIDFGEQIAVGPGKIALLECMRDTGSLSKAARAMKMSYRRAWQLLESLNASFREPVVLTTIGGKGGGGTVITALGEALVAAYRELERDVTQKANARFRPLSAQVVHAIRRRRPLKKTSPTRVRSSRGTPKAR
jgi:molybdate transport system regulatory protein